MYDTEIILNIIEEARNLVAKKRKKYDHLMKIIEFFISENDIIVREATEYFYDLYTLDMFNLPLKLTNLLYETDPDIAKYVTLEIKIYKYHSRITIDGIPFVHFTYINPEIRQNILDYTCTGIHTKVIYKCFGPEVLLINLYADLINPALFKNWVSLSTIEYKMSNEIITHLTERIGGGNSSYKRSLIDQMMDIYFGNIHSTKRNTKKYDSDIEYSTHAKISSESNKYKNIVLNNFICDQHVLVGQIAINIYKGIKHIGRIQIVTSRSLNDEIKILKGLIGASITYSINNLKIPTNLNLHKMTIFYEKDAIIDIYDAGTFELISYNTMDHDFQGLSLNHSLKFNVGSPFVIMRFRLIDIWSTLYNMKAGNLSKEVAISVVHKLIADYVEMRNKMNDLDISNIFSLKYVGYLEDQQLNKMRIAARLRVKFIQPYMPYFANK